MANLDINEIVKSVTVVQICKLLPYALLIDTQWLSFTCRIRFIYYPIGYLESITSLETASLFLISIIVRWISVFFDDGNKMEVK